MSPHVITSTQLLDFELGATTGALRAEVEDHVRGCGACARELETIRDALTLLADGLTTAPASATARSKFMQEIEGRRRYAPFTKRVAAIFDLDETAAALALEKIVDDGAWRPGPIPGLRISPLRPGPRRNGWMTTFIAGDPGARFPLHRHLGEEIVLVMQGAFRENDGTLAAPGETVLKAASSTHDFVIVGEAPCVCAYAIEQGFVLEN
jgi:hypothetical protein